MGNGRKDRGPLRFGVFEVDFRTGELRKQGVRIKLQGQPLQVLETLLERRGEVVSRDELRQKIWPADTFVDFDHGLYNAVKRLREALGDSPDSPRFVETLSRRGYRFVAPVDDLGMPEPLPTKPEANVPLKKRTSATITLVSLLVIACLIAATGGYRKYFARDFEAKTTSPLAMVSVVNNLRGLIMWSSFSPDGKSMAFAWTGGKEHGYDVYIKTINGNELPRRLTNHPGDWVFPDWSPDGNWIAFTRYEGQNNGLYLIPAGGGKERQLSTLNARAAMEGVAWSRDSKEVIFPDKADEGDNHSLFVLPLDGTKPRRLTIPRENFEDGMPTVSHDGLSLAFVRSRNLNSDICVTPVSGGEPLKVVSDLLWVDGITWSPNDRRLLFVGQRRGARGLWVVDAQGGEPRLLMPTLTRASILDPQFSSLRQLSLALLSFEETILHLGTSNNTILPLLTQPAGHEEFAQFSPDGKRVVFQSDRSGDWEIWMADRNGGNATQVTRMEGHASDPRWSPDSASLVFDVRDATRSGIYLISAGGGTPQRLEAGSQVDEAPSWSIDGRWIYFSSYRTGKWQVWKVPVGGGGGLQVTHGGGYAPLESSDGTLYFAKGKDLPGIWKASPHGNETSVVNAPPGGYWADWTITRHGIYFIDPNARSGPAIEVFDFATQSTRLVLRLAKYPYDFAQGLSVSSDERDILFPEYGGFVSSLVLVNNVPQI